MAKAPAFQFYPGDWRRDTQVQMASMATRGVWTEMLCCMWDAPERGVLCGTNDQLSRLLGCAKEEFENALNEIEFLEIGDVSRDCNRYVTVKSRRMIKDDKERTNNKIRKRAERKRGSKSSDVTDESRKCHANVTPSSSSSSSSSLLTTEINNAREEGKIQPGELGKIIDLWNKKSGCLPIIELSAFQIARLAKLFALYPQYGWWDDLFVRIKKEMPHLQGKNDKEWRAGLGWIIEEKNWANVINGQYVTKEKNNAKRTGKRRTHASRVNSAISGKLRVKNAQQPSF